MKKKLRLKIIKILKIFCFEHEINKQELIEVEFFSDLSKG